MSIYNCKKETAFFNIYPLWGFRQNRRFHYKKSFVLVVYIVTRNIIICNSVIFNKVILTRVLLFLSFKNYEFGRQPILF